MSAHKLTKALRAHTARMSREAGDTTQLGEILSTDPLKVELHDSRVVLDSNELTMTQWVKKYDAQDEIDVGDTVILIRKHTGGEIHWLISDILADKTPTV